MSAIIPRIIAVAAALFLLPAMAKTPRVAILGDSIPYSGQWPTLIEAAMRQSPVFKNAEIVNFCLPSETASGQSEPGHAGGRFPRPCIHDRLDSILSKYKPTLVLACYGMNDGMMQAFKEENLRAYQNGMTKLKKKVESTGARLIVITPPLFMADNPDRDSQHYNQVLDTYSEWLVKQKKNGWMVVDMRPSLTAQIKETKEKQPGFVYAGDGVHPGDEGHAMIANAVWPGLAACLRLPAKPNFPEGREYKEALAKNNLYKLAWLTETGHKRPGIPKGIPVKYLALIKDGVSVSNWNGFPKLDFKVADRNALLVIPDKAAPNRPWIWRTEFFGHEPQTDVALLKEGYHVAYIDMQNMYGAPPALDIMDQFYDVLTKQYRLSPKTVLEGLSRGGLFAFNWAARNPGRVAAMYVDAPVCDVTSWPGGKGKGEGSPGDWKRLLEIYKVTEQEAMTGKLNPLNNLAPLAKAKIPIIAVVGDADKVVPLDENMAIVEQKYKKLGGPIKVINKPGVGHHPHSLKDPTPIVEFILDAVKKNGGRAAGKPATARTAAR